MWMKTQLRYLTGAEDIACRQSNIYRSANCATCHRKMAVEMLDPTLPMITGYMVEISKDIFKTIKYGINKGMRSWKDDLFQ